MQRAFWAATVFIAGLGAGAAPATAVTCEELFAMMGRTFVADAPTQDAGVSARQGIAGCPAEQHMQFVIDFPATKAAVKVDSLDQLLGTWVSDDVLATYAGIFIPVYEVIEITRAEGEGRIAVVQKLMRSIDPESYLADNYSPAGPIDVVAAGRIATYGEHVLELARAGELHPKHVRYHEFPLEADRNTSLTMKRRYMSFLQQHPIEVATDGERLVLTMFDRLAPGGNRIMTFRKRGEGMPEIALQIAVMAEVSLGKFHCLLEAVDRPTPAFTTALGDVSREEFFTTLREAYEIGTAREELSAKLMALAPDDERGEALAKRIRAITETTLAQLERPAMVVLQEQVESGAPFGCADFY